MRPLLLAFVAGCTAEHPQSTLHPGGPAAAEIAWLTWVLTAVLTVVFAITMALAAVALVRKRRRDEPAELGTGFVIVAGIAIPTVILFGILALAVQTQVGLRAREGAVTIRVIGHQFWWEVRYPEQGVVTANHLVLPSGVPVQLELSSRDVIHSFWVPNLHGKMDMLPERTHFFWLQADEPGTWRGICAEYCGTQHAKMAFTVAAVEPEVFEQWLAAQAAPPSLPEGAAAEGRAIFVDAGCSACHTVAGVSESDRGPDLTHLASRPTLGAGEIRNTPENLRAWIRDPQRIKPGNLMPPSHMPDDELDRLVAWLWSLE